MAYEELRREDWSTFFDQISNRVSGNRVELEIAGLDIGDQTEERDAHLHGLSYDPNDDLFFVATDKLEHNITHPRRVYADRDGVTVHEVMVVDESERKHFIKLKPPLELPAHQ